MNPPKEPTVDELKAENALLRALVDEFRADSERLDVLQKLCDRGQVPNIGVTICTGHGEDDVLFFNPSNLRVIIDLLPEPEA